MELVSKLGLGNINIGTYVKNITSYSQHSSDSDNTTIFKAFMKETKAQTQSEAEKRKTAEYKLRMCEQDIVSLKTDIATLQSKQQTNITIINEDKGLVKKLDGELTTLRVQLREKDRELESLKRLMRVGEEGIILNDDNLIGQE